MKTAEKYSKAILQNQRTEGLRDLSCCALYIPELVVVVLTVSLWTTLFLILKKQDKALMKM